MNYLSPEDYEQAEKNGISKRQAYYRFYMRNWSKEDTITVPIGSKRKVKPYPFRSYDSVVSRRTFERRIKKGWSPEKAASTPPKGRNQYMKKPANETSREELLKRDVKILFDENRELKQENYKLKQVIEAVKEWVNCVESK